MCSAGTVGTSARNQAPCGLCQVSGRHKPHRDFPGFPALSLDLRDLEPEHPRGAQRGQGLVLHTPAPASRHDVSTSGLSLFRVGGPEPPGTGPPCQTYLLWDLQDNEAQFRSQESSAGGCHCCGPLLGCPLPSRHWRYQRSQQGNCFPRSSKHLSGKNPLTTRQPGDEPAPPFAVCRAQTRGSTCTRAPAGCSKAHPASRPQRGPAQAEEAAGSALPSASHPSSLASVSSSRKYDHRRIAGVLPDSESR